MPFLNRIRLPIKVSRPQFPEEREVFRKANGVSKTISVVVRKTYLLETALMPERLHERLKIALVHDTVNIETDKYFGGVSQSADYTIGWPEFQDFPVAKGNSTIEVTPFNASNNNCATCEDMNQVVAEDDTFPGTLEEGEEYSINVLTNDNVCCFPVVVSIVTTNAGYIQSASVDPATGVVTIIMKATLATADGINLLTYRVTCPNGGYDEADVFGDTEGSVPGCTAPQNVHDALPPFDDAHTIEWDDSSPADGYQWLLYKESNLGTPVQQASTPFASAAMVQLDPCTDYRFFVRSVCNLGTSLFSEYTQITFSTACAQTGCGKYEVTYDNGFPDTDSFTDVYYLDCASQQQIMRINNHQTRIVCLLQNSPGDPVSLVSNSQGVNYFYLSDGC